MKRHLSTSHLLISESQCRDLWSGSFDRMYPQIGGTGIDSCDDTNRFPYSGAANREG